MTSVPPLSFPKNEPCFKASDYIVFLNSSDLPNEMQSPGPSACIWQIRTMDGQLVDDPDAKRSQTGTSDEKRGLAAALVGALERVGSGSFCIIYAPGTYISDGVAHAREWKARGWRNSQNEPIANPEIWDRYLELLDNHSLDVCSRKWRKDCCAKLRSYLNCKARNACKERD